MAYEVRYSEAFYAKALEIGGTPLGSKVLDLVRRVAASPRTVGREGLSAPCIRFGSVGQGAYFVNWAICEECFSAPVEARPEPCGLCGESNEVWFLSLYIAF